LCLVRPGRTGPGRVAGRDSGDGIREESSVVLAAAPLAAMRTLGALGVGPRSAALLLATCCLLASAAGTAFTG
jgi:hypothetical protein